MKQLFFLAIIYLVFSTHLSYSQETLHKSSKLEEQFIQLNTGVKLEYVEKGDVTGVPVIFLHGLSDSWHSFESMLPHLPASVHAYAISQRGHGDSERPPGGYHPKDFAADVAAFIKQKKLGKAIIAGHSMGGVNAQQFALDYPQLTKALVIIDSDPAWKDNPGMPEFYQQSLQLQGSIDRPFMDEFQKSTLARPIDPAYYNLIVDEGLKVPANVFKAAFAELLKVDYTNQLKLITAPVLVFWGDKDSFCSKKDQEQLISGIANSKLIIYENTGHALHWEEPARFAKDITAFVNNIIK